ncbi:MAG: hypothetical protein ACTSQJ_19715 [Promethearchaeota archaeon]
MTEKPSKQIEKIKKIHADLKTRLANRFYIIKSSLGIQTDAEVIRFLIQYYYRKKFETRGHLKEKGYFTKGINPKEDKELIDKIMDKYGDAIKRLGEE